MRRRGTTIGPLRGVSHLGGSLGWSTYGDLLVLLHAVQHHLDDLPPQTHALIVAVVRVGQVEERRAARHLDALVVLVALERGDHQLAMERNAQRGMRVRREYDLSRRRREIEQREKGGGQDFVH